MDVPKTDTGTEHKTKQGNLKSNISMVFQNGSNSIINKDEKLFLDDSTTTKQRFSPIWRQSLAASGSIIATVSAGMTSGFSATLLPQLKQPDSTILLTQEIESWIAGIAALPMFAGCIISGFVMEPLGRRLTHLVLAIPYIIGWILIATTSNLPQLLIGRFISGLCVGLLGPAGSIYIGEISDPRYRGFLLAGISLAISVGLLIVHIIGTFLDWHLTAAISSLVPFVSYVIMSFVPESPSWLASKGKIDKARKAFKWLRGCDQAANDELEALLAKQAAAAVEAEAKPKIPFFSLERLEILKDTFRRPEFVKPLLIMIAFFMTLQMSGVNAVAFYSVSIMKSTLGEGFDEYIAMLIIDLVRLIVAIITCIVLRRVGRRPLAMFSGLSTVFSLYGLVIFKYLTVNSESDLSWVPLLFLIAYIVATTAGLAPLPWIMTGEVFPVDLRGMGSGICTSVCFIIFFLVVKLAPAMFSSLGNEGTFLSYGTVALIGTCLMYIFLPETKDRTLQDIEESFKTKTKILVENDPESK